jgi:ferredoxin-type protein NapF
MAEVDRTKRTSLYNSVLPAALFPPPWALPLADFLSACTRCGDCISACPEKIILRGDGNYPTVDFTGGECTFCGLCVAVCAPRALSLESDPPWTLVAQIDDSCLTRQNIYCQICGSRCPVHAIEFEPAFGDAPQPRLNTSRCVGCGACVSECPTQAIQIRRSDAT